MIKPVHILLLAACATASAQVEFADTRTIDHQLREEPAVLVNAQGLAQHDLSIRGSGYTGAGISINGLNLKVPYSAHFNAELPLLGTLLSASQVRTGLDNVSGHFIGTAAYATVPQTAGVQAGSSAGTENHYTATLSGQAGGTGGFFDWEKANRIDHDANDLDRYAGGAHVQVEQNDWLIDLMGSHQWKEFGAQGYYGLPSSVYAEDRFEDTLFFGSAVHGELDDAYFRASTAWRQFDDKYRIRSENFESDIRSRYGALVLEGRTMEVQNIALNLRADFESEEIDKDLGSHSRTRGSVLVMPEARFEHFNFTAGLNTVLQSSESAEWLPQAGVEWLATDNSTLYATYSENVQQPDYQMLHYTDPYHIGNSNLDQQKTRNTELGIRQFVSAHLDWRAAAFYRSVDNAADWTKENKADVEWTATDLGNLDVAGAEAEINYYPSDELELRAFYQWVHKDNYDFYAGLYELDYPEHLLAFSGNWKFSPDFELFAVQSLRWQTDNAERSSSGFGADASVGLHWFPRFAHNARLSFLADNLWGTNFQAIPGLKRRGPSVSAGLAVAW